MPYNLQGLLRAAGSCSYSVQLRCSLYLRIDRKGLVSSTPLVSQGGSEKQLVLQSNVIPMNFSLPSVRYMFHAKIQPCFDLCPDINPGCQMVQEARPCKCYCVVLVG